MEWRCKWCEKPHEENDPPCDNCGHGEFEKAVVPMSPESTDDSTPQIWACTECGREHQKNSPPCSRCGNAMLEQRDVDYSDVEEMESTGWSDILDRKYAAGFAIVGVLALVLGLGLAGVVDIPGIGPPQPPEVPGENESINGVSLFAAEDAFVETVNEDREESDVSTLDRRDTLDQMATYFNKRQVEAAYADADEPTADELDPFNPGCGGSRVTILTETVDDGVQLVEDPDNEYQWEAQSMGELVDDYTTMTTLQSVADQLRDRETREAIGADIHVAPDDDIYVTTVSC